MNKKLKITLCKKDAEEFMKNPISNKFEVTINLKDCEFCRQRIEDITSANNTREISNVDIGESDCDAGVCPIR